MSSMAPDWRVIGGAAGPETGVTPTESGRPVVSARGAALACAAAIGMVVVGAMAALLVMPGPGGVLVDVSPANGAWSGHTPAVIDGVAAGAGSADGRAVEPLVVDVEGAVVRPGLITIPPGGRVGDAIALAGGFAANADLGAAAGALNLAQEVTDGLKVVVPAMGTTAMADASVGASSHASDGPVDLNRATEAQLDSLPGVGPATIAKIVAARAQAPFTSVDELRSRDIVGDATFGKLRDLVSVGS